MLSVVIPVHNEAGNVERVVAGVRAACRGLAHEIVVVDDGSCDGTRDVLRGFVRKKWVRVVGHGARLGYDVALSSGVAAARGDVIALVDGDGQTDVSSLRSAVAGLGEGEMVVGCRRNRESFLRAVNSRCYRSFLKVVFGLGLSDINGKPKVFWRRDLAHTRPSSIRSGVYDLLLLLEADKKGLRVREIPVRHLPRISGRSKMKLADLPRIVLLVLSLRFAGRGRASGF